MQIKQETCSLVPFAKNAKDSYSNNFLTVGYRKKKNEASQTSQEGYSQANLHKSEGIKGW